MAQNIFINATADKSAASTPDSQHHHTVIGGAAASGDLTVSFDNTVVTSLNVFDSLIKQVRLRAVSAGLK